MFKLANIVFYLGDIAQARFNNPEDKIDSGDTFKTRLYDMFGCPVGRNENSEHRIASRPGTVFEVVISFIEVVQSLCKRAEGCMSESEKVELIMKGINEDAFVMLAS